MIVTEGLGKTIDGRKIVDDVSFELHPGEVVGLVGPNGAGKSTTMKLMVNAVRGQGRTLFDGVAYADMISPWQQVGVLLDPNMFYPGRSARKHLLMLARGSGLPDSSVERTLALTGLSGRRSNTPASYSLGMRQRLGLSSALLGDPSVLVLDEPANGLDVEGVTWLRQLLRTFAEDGRTVLLSSHLLAELEQVADRVLFMAGGRLVADTRLSDLAGSSDRTYSVVRCDRPEALATALRLEGATVEDQGPQQLSVRGMPLKRIGEIASAETCTLYELSAHTMSLEEHFVDLVGPGHRSATTALEEIL